MTLQGAAIPYICTFFATLVLGRSADRLRELRWHLVIPALAGSGKNCQPLNTKHQPPPGGSIRAALSLQDWRTRHVTAC